MGNYDITDDGRRRIISADQRKNLLERARLTEQLEQALAEGGGCSWPDIAARIRRDEKKWDELGEESQVPEWDEPA